jgi:hypothetical protein
MPLRVGLSSGLGHARSASTAWPLEEGETSLSGARGRLLVLVGKKVLLTSAIVHCLELRELPPGAKPAWPKAEALRMQFNSSFFLSGAKGNEHAMPCTACHEEWNPLAPERDLVRLEFDACDRAGSVEWLF